MSRKTGSAQSRAKFFRHSAVLSLTAVLLREVSIVFVWRRLFSSEIQGVANMDQMISISKIPINFQRLVQCFEPALSVPVNFFGKGSYNFQGGYTK